MMYDLYVMMVMMMLKIKEFVKMGFWSFGMLWVWLNLCVVLK